MALDLEAVLVGAALVGPKILEKMPVEFVDEGVTRAIAALRAGDGGPLKTLLGAPQETSKILEWVKKTVERRVASKHLRLLAYDMRLVSKAPDDEWKSQRVKSLQEQINHWSEVLK